MDPFLERAIARTFADGQVIQQQGDAASGCWIVTAGQVKVGQFTPSGKFVTLTVLGPEQSYGELALLRGAPRAVDAVAVGETRLLWIEGAHFERVLAQHPATMRRLLALLGHQLHYTMESLFAARGKRAEQSLAGLLAAVCDDLAPPIRVPLTQQDLAELTGVTRVTIGKALAAFARIGALRQVYGGVEIDDPAALRRIANGA